MRRGRGRVQEKDGGIDGCDLHSQGTSRLLGGDKSEKKFGRKKGEKSEAVGASVKVFHSSL